MTIRAKGDAAHTLRVTGSVRNLPDYAVAEKLLGAMLGHPWVFLAILVNDDIDIHNPEDVFSLLDENEFTIIQVQTQTIIHEGGHGLGVSKNHVADDSGVMYIPVLDWARADLFSPEAIRQMMFHNKTESVTP